MKNLKTVAGAMALAAFASCSTESANTDSGKTPEAEFLQTQLTEVSRYGFMVGHHDDPVYGIGWDGDSARSDIKSVCGDYPAVMSFDLGRIELGGDMNLDKVPFDRIRKEAVAQYERGGVVSFSWHVDNPVTGKDSWDVSDSTVVRSVLPGGANYEKFMGWIDKAADFLNSIQTKDGVKVPALFRPWHEHTGSWFWWGQALCSTDEYKELWQMTYNRMQEKGATQLLYAYSPGYEPQDSTAYLERYPGDSIIDLIGVDGYQFDRDAYLKNMDGVLAAMKQVSETHGKPMAVTETGYETIPDSVWWTQTLLPLVEKYPVSYVLFWRNARERENHYYAPYPGHASEADFMKFYESPKTLFVNDFSKIDFKSTNDKQRKL